MDGCVGCFSTQKSINERLQTIQNDAKEYAIQHQKNVFIYLDETNVWQFMEEEAARAVGIQPTGGVVSFLRPMSAI